MGGVLMRRHETARIWGRAALSLALLAIGIACCFPFVMMVSSAFKTQSQVFEFPVRIVPRAPVFDNFRDLFSPDYLFLRWCLNTVVMEAVTVILKLAVTGITAYAFARLRFPGRDAIFLLLLSALMIPGEVTLIPKYIVYRFLGVTDTLWAMVLPYTFEVFLVFLVRQFFLTIPFELSEAALMDGCGHLRIFARVIAPLARPAIVTMLLFTFVWSWNDFTNPFIFITTPRRQMISVGIQYFQTQASANYPLQMAAATLVLLPVIGAFLAAQKHFIEGLTSGAVKG